MNEYWEIVTDYWLLQDSNCYWVIDAWFYNEPKRLKYIWRNTIDYIINTLISTPEQQILPQKLIYLLKNRKTEKGKKYFINHYEQISSYQTFIENKLKKYEWKILIIEFFDEKKRSQHVAFITPSKKIYDKINTWKFNLWYEIKEMFDFWILHWSNYYKLYIVDEEHTKNINDYIDYLIYQKQLRNERYIKPFKK